ncbi:Probable RNA-directed DNA polymerase from transposon BS [Eumeta japonica]|uniref:Probable RNA-directed DNA polymerase from transposon BS n=1 Tax=Eumeta variegata TaxID=151549 RepID=A0A4C2A4G5_EUMVA|nr:Probable RNA-directed DNA polymerase from transposon BS [Eumeta japonica]
MISRVRACSKLYALVNARVSHTVYARCAIDISDVMRKKSMAQYSHASYPHDIAHINRIEEEVLHKTSLEPKYDLPPVSLSEVQMLVKSLKTRKAPGLDGISNKTIKYFSLPLLSLLVAIFNACLKNCYFPPAWRKAEVIGIHKPGKTCDLLASYRPISLLSGLGKLFERILKTRLNDHLLGKGPIIDKQFGFRPVRSCPHQVLRLIESSSRLLPLTLLYSAYTNNIPRPSSGVQLALFVDDTALFFSSRYKQSILLYLQRVIDELGQWFRFWRIEVNPKKSTATLFKYCKIRSRHIVDYDTPNLKLLNANIPWQRSHKYLEVTIDKNLHFRDYIARVRKTALFYRARLGAMLGRKSKLSRRNKRTIYKMCIRTVMTYASPVFAHATPKTLNRLQVIQNKFCRSATDAHWCVRNSILHRDLELPTLSKYMKDASKRFFDIAGLHPNVLLRAAVDYEPPHPTYFIRRPRKVLNDLPDALTAAVEILNEVNDTHD